MKTFSLISLCFLLIGANVRGQQTGSTVGLKMNRPERIASQPAATIQAKVIDLLKTSNFNSSEHPGPMFQDGSRGVHRRYREVVAGQYLVVRFLEPLQFELIRGQVTTIEVLVGLNNMQYADALFTIDPEGRVVEHSKFSGKLATELLELVGKAEKRGEPDGMSQSAEDQRKIVSVDFKLIDGPDRAGSLTLSEQKTSITVQVPVEGRLQAPRGAVDTRTPPDVAKLGLQVWLLKVDGTAVSQQSAGRDPMAIGGVGIENWFVMFDFAKVPLSEITGVVFLREGKLYSQQLAATDWKP